MTLPFERPGDGMPADSVLIHHDGSLTVMWADDQEQAFDVLPGLPIRGSFELDQDHYRLLQLYCDGSYVLWSDDTSTDHFFEPKQSSPIHRMGGESVLDQFTGLVADAWGGLDNPPRITGFETKDSGAREEYASGMVRDTQDGKPRFDLMWPEGVPFENQFMTRIARLLSRGATKYGDRNWERGNGQEELNRAKASASRHFAQWLSGEVDEDHAAAVFFNLMQTEMLKYKMGVK